jgi:hypothetical protein
MYGGRCDIGAAFDLRWARSRFQFPFGFAKMLFRDTDQARGRSPSTPIVRAPTLIPKSVPDRGEQELMPVR